MEFLIREIVPGDFPLLREFLNEAISLSEGFSSALTAHGNLSAVSAALVPVRKSGCGGKPLAALTALVPVRKPGCGENADRAYAREKAGLRWNFYLRRFKIFCNLNNLCRFRLHSNDFATGNRI